MEHPVSRAGAPFSTPVGTKSLIATRPRYPTVSTWLPPSEENSIGTRSTPSISPIRPESRRRASQLTAEHRPELCHLLVGGGFVNQQLYSPVSLEDVLRQLADHGHHRPCDINSFDLARVNVKRLYDQAVIVVGPLEGDTLQGHTTSQLQHSEVSTSIDHAMALPPCPDARDLASSPRKDLKRLTIASAETVMPVLKVASANIPSRVTRDVVVFRVHRRSVMLEAFRLFRVASVSAELFVAIDLCRGEQRAGFEVRA